MALPGGGDGPVELSEHAFRPQEHIELEVYDGGIVLLIAVESGRVRLHMGGDQAADPLDRIGEPSAADIILRDLPQVAVVARAVFLHLKQFLEDGALFGRGARIGVVDGEVDRVGGGAELVRPKERL